MAAETDTPPTSLDDIHHVIAVASGKGGVGKSTVSVNLALAFAEKRYSVGLLDADVYGPNVPQMMGVSGSLEKDSSGNAVGYYYFWSNETGYVQIPVMRTIIEEIKQ